MKSKKNKLIFADYDEDTGISEVVLQNRDNIFVGTAFCHPDEESPSDFAGCRYAEARANIQSVQYEKNILTAQIEELERFEKILLSLKEYNPHSLEGRRLRRRIYELKEKRQKLRDKIKSMKSALSQAMAERDEWLAKKAKQKDKTE